MKLQNIVEEKIIGRVKYKDNAKKSIKNFHTRKIINFLISIFSFSIVFNQVGCLDTTLVDILRGNILKDIAIRGQRENSISKSFQTTATKHKFDTFLEVTYSLLTFFTLFFMISV